MEQNLWGDLYIAKKNLVKSPKKILASNPQPPS